MTASDDRPATPTAWTVHHQPGDISADIRVHANGDTIAEVYIWSKDEEPEAFARARLMAAAPMLKEALNAAMTQMAFMASVIKCGEPWTHTMNQAYRAAQAAASAALEAARPTPADDAGGA